MKSKNTPTTAAALAAAIVLVGLFIVPIGSAGHAQAFRLGSFGCSGLTGQCTEDWDGMHGTVVGAPLEAGTGIFLRNGALIDTCRVPTVGITPNLCRTDGGGPYVYPSGNCNEVDLETVLDITGHTASDNWNSPGC